jgi:methionine synthase reductase
MAHLIQMLPGLTSRAYTLCSYHDTNQGSINEHEMEIVFNLIHFEVNECRTYRRTGVATGFLSSLHENESFYFLKRKFQNFTFPSDNKHALILIGPGTGISPFVSYLRQQRYCETQKEHQQTWLFYGCRDPFKDFLFKDEMLNVLSVSLTKLAVAYSQFEADKSSESDKFYVQDCKYVQDCIKYYSREVVSMLVEQNGSVYLCGDAKNMSKDVVQCLTECLVKEKGFTMDEAKKYLTNMISNKRLKQDIWA